MDVFFFFAFLKPKRNFFIICFCISIANSNLPPRVSGEILGTDVVKFTPSIDTETIIKNATMHQMIHVRRQCICIMKEYEDYSMEELRLQDYTSKFTGRGEDK